MNLSGNNRILIIDDNAAIHDDFKKILVAATPATAELDDMMASVFGATPATRGQLDFQIDSAFQGQEGLAKVEAALAAGRPYALAFVDVRMPPGWDGVETITHIWAKDPTIKVVICTAYSDYSWHEIVQQLGNSDRLVILKKPFDNIEVLQLAHAMTKKWTVTRQAAQKFEELDRLVQERTQTLETLNVQLTAEITERAKAQSAVQLSEERLARAFDACPLPAAILRVFDQGCVQVNPAFLTTTERESAEVIGRTLWEAGLEASEEFRRVAITRLFQGDAIRRHECEFHTRSGERRRALLWLEPFALASGPHVLAILQDVSDQHALEGQLRQAQKMEAVGHLAAGVAHDFNNLLTVIQGHASMRLETANLDRKVAASLAAVKEAAERAGDLTRQLLVFSRKQVMEKQPLRLCTVITNVSAMLQRLIPESITIGFAHPGDLPLIRADRCSAEQVVMNLVVNARDAMPAGGHITVATAAVEVDAAHAQRSAEARAGHFVCLRVSDTGTGIDEATLRHVFEPFFTTKEIGHGTGLGLATVHGIVKQHDGWIEITTAPGAGTTFHVYLPVTDATEEAVTAEGSGSFIALEGCTVLLAEDDPDVRALVMGVLVDCGCRVVEAASGPEALDLWHTHRDDIDLLFTDMVMPGGMTGIDLAEKILGERGDLKVIYSSGYSPNLFAENLRLREGVNYLPKPYLAKQLTGIVTRAFGDGAPLEAVA